MYHETVKLDPESCPLNPFTISPEHRAGYLPAL